MDTPVFLLHGLGPSRLTAITLWPLERYLHYKGFKNTQRIAYPVNTMSEAESIDYVDAALQKHADKAKHAIILIGQSMGGRVANQMHTKGWQVKCALYIVSPLHGAKLLNQLEPYIPRFIHKWLYKKPYDDLKKCEQDATPPHPYHTISTGWLRSAFDGCVYRHETMLDADCHTHFTFSDHRALFVDPRLWRCVYRFLQRHCDVKA